MLKQSPKLTAFWGEYFKFYKSAKDARRHGTLRLEKTARKSWLEYLPDLRLKEITRKHINGELQQCANNTEKEQWQIGVCSDDGG